MPKKNGKNVSKNECDKQIKYLNLLIQMVSSCVLLSYWFSKKILCKWFHCSAPYSKTFLRFLLQSRLRNGTHSCLATDDIYIRYTWNSYDGKIILPRIVARQHTLYGYKSDRARFPITKQRKKESIFKIYRQICTTR